MSDRYDTSILNFMKEVVTMSAYVVEAEHIRYLLASAMAMDSQGPFRWYHRGSEAEATFSSHVLDYTNADEIGQMLWGANYDSVNSRYSEEDSAPVYSHPVFKRYDLDAVQILKACDCYEYQSCETSDWDTSLAHAFIESLRRQAVTKLAGYSDAEWGPPLSREAQKAKFEKKFSHFR